MTGSNNKCTEVPKYNRYLLKWTIQQHLTNALHFGCIWFSVEYFSHVATLAFRSGLQIWSNSVPSIFRSMLHTPSALSNARNCWLAIKRAPQRQGRDRRWAKNCEAQRAIYSYVCVEHGNASIRSPNSEPIHFSSNNPRNILRNWTNWFATFPARQIFDNFLKSQTRLMRGLQVTKHEIARGEACNFDFVRSCFSTLCSKRFYNNNA